MSSAKSEKYALSKELTNKYPELNKFNTKSLKPNQCLNACWAFTLSFINWHTSLNMHS